MIFLPFWSTRHSCNWYFFLSAGSSSMTTTSSSSSATESPGGAAVGFTGGGRFENAPEDLALSVGFLLPPFGAVAPDFRGLCEAFSCESFERVP